MLKGSQNSNSCLLLAVQLFESCFPTQELMRPTTQMAHTFFGHVFHHKWMKNSTHHHDHYYTCVLSATHHPPIIYLQLSVDPCTHFLDNFLETTTIFSSTTITLLTLNNSRYLCRHFRGTASPSTAGFVLHFMSLMDSSIVIEPKPRRIGDVSVHGSPSVCTSAPAGSPSVWACVLAGLGALSTSGSISRAVNHNLTPSSQLHILHISS